MFWASCDISRSQKLVSFSKYPLVAIFDFADFGRALDGIYGEFQESDIWLFGDTRTNFQL